MVQIYVVKLHYACIDVTSTFSSYTKHISEMLVLTGEKVGNLRPFLLLFRKSLRLQIAYQIRAIMPYLHIYGI